MSRDSFYRFYPLESNLRSYKHSYQRKISVSQCRDGWTNNFVEITDPNLLTPIPVSFFSSLFLFDGTKRLGGLKPAASRASQNAQFRRVVNVNEFVMVDDNDRCDKAREILSAIYVGELRLIMRPAGISGFLSLRAATNLTLSKTLELRLATVSFANSRHVNQI